MEYKFWCRVVEGWQIKTSVSLLFVALFGEWAANLGALTILVTLDWITKWWVLAKQAGGLAIAWKTDIISSRGMRAGLKKIVWYGITLIVGHQLSHLKIMGYAVGNVSTEVFCAYLMLIEAKSILENLRDLGFSEVGPLGALLGRKCDQLTGEQSNPAITANTTKGET